MAFPYDAAADSQSNNGSSSSIGFVEPQRNKTKPNHAKEPTKQFQRSARLYDAILLRKSPNQTTLITAFPVFVKLHVVGSSTFTFMLRCLAASRAVPAFRAVGNGYWNSKLCGQEQGHQAAELLAQQGVHALLCCVKEASVLQVPGARIRLVVLLRHPIEKYLSSVYTFVQGDAKRILLSTTPQQVTLKTLNLAAVNVWGNRSAVKNIIDPRKRWAAKQILEKQSRVRGSMHEIRAVFRKAEQLRAFAAVGITESYDEFLVLVGLVMQWPPGTLCYRKKMHSNPNR
jgi:hypothetical protein